MKEIIYDINGVLRDIHYQHITHTRMILGEFSPPCVL